MHPLIKFSLHIQGARAKCMVLPNLRYTVHNGYCLEYRKTQYLYDQYPLVDFNIYGLVHELWIFFNAHPLLPKPPSTDFDLFCINCCYFINCTPKRSIIKAQNEHISNSSLLCECRHDTSQFELSPMELTLHLRIQILYF